MNTSDLIEQTNLEMTELVSKMPPKGQSSMTLHSHDRLVKIARNACKQSEKKSNRVASLSQQLLEEINRISMEVVSLVPEALAKVRATNATYLCEFDPIGEPPSYSEYAFEKITLLCATQVGFVWLQLVRTLLPKRQTLLFSWIDLRIEINYLSVHEQFADDEVNLEERQALSIERLDLQREFKKLETAIGTTGRQVGDAFFRDVHGVVSHDVQRCPCVLALTSASLNSSAEQYAINLEEAAHQLIQPLPLHANTIGNRRKQAKLAWAAVDDLRMTLLMLTVWIRAIPKYKKKEHCDLCYRYLSGRMKVYCHEHARVNGKRQESKEFHIAKQFAQELKALSSNNNDFVLNLTADAYRAGDYFQNIVNKGKVELPFTLRQSALQLEYLVTQLNEAFGPSLKEHAMRVYLATIVSAIEPFHGDRPISPEEAIAQKRNKDDAVNWICWNTFFQLWYGKSATTPWHSLVQPEGSAFDLNHPIVWGHKPPPSTIFSDILRQHAWTNAKAKITSTAYVSISEIILLSKKLSLREIAAKVGISRETVRKVIKSQMSGPVKYQPRSRITPAAKNRLLKWFFVNFTVIFPLLRDNPVIQYFQLEHERYRAV